LRAGLDRCLRRGTKELLAVVDGYRESAQSWRELLHELNAMKVTVEIAS
jgi:hypothetical protein